MEQFNYILAEVTTEKQQTNPISFGICVPQVCKVSDLNAFKPYIVPAVNSLLPFAFEDVQGLELENL